MICPDKEAIVFEGKRYTFAQLNERTNRLANTLLKLGIKKGDLVATVMVNCNQFVETYFACAKIGAVYVPLNYRAKGNENDILPDTRRLSDNSTGGSGKIVFNEYGRRKH